MAIVAEEYFRGRTGDAFTEREREYLVTGTGPDTDLDEYNAIIAAVNVSPASLLSTDALSPLHRTNASIGRFISNSQAIVTVQYGEAGGGGVSVPPLATVQYEFNYQAPSVLIKQSLETISITDALSMPVDTDFFEGAIGVRNDDGDKTAEGVTTAPGNTTSVWTFTAVPIDSDYEVVVENLMGCVNSQPFKDRPVGSMRFVSCTSQSTYGQSKAQIRFGFQYEKNTTNIPIGNITVPAKNGHDYLWVYYEPKVKNNRILPSPQYVAVERIFRYEDLNQLGF